MSLMVWLSTGDMKVEIGVTGDGGSPMGYAKWAEWAKKPNVGKIGKNGQKMRKKILKSTDFLFDINASILQPPNDVSKK